MAHRAIIGLEIGFGGYIVKAVFVHHNGHIDHMRDLLLQEWQDRGKVAELLLSGNSIDKLSFDTATTDFDKLNKLRTLPSEAFEVDKRVPLPFDGAEFAYILDVYGDWYVCKRGIDNRWARVEVL